MKLSEVARLIANDERWAEYIGGLDEFEYGFVIGMVTVYFAVRMGLDMSNMVGFKPDGDKVMELINILDPKEFIDNGSVAPMRRS